MPLIVSAKQWLLILAVAIPSSLVASEIYDPEKVISHPDVSVTFDDFRRLARSDGDFIRIVCSNQFPVLLRREFIAARLHADAPADWLEGVDLEGMHRHQSGQLILERMIADRQATTDFSLIAEERYHANPRRFEIDSGTFWAVLPNIDGVASEAIDQAGVALKRKGDIDAKLKLLTDTFGNEVQIFTTEPADLESAIVFELDASEPFIPQFDHISKELEAAAREDHAARLSADITQRYALGDEAEVHNDNIRAMRDRFGC